jgi:hypothetical protein
MRFIICILSVVRSRRMQWYGYVACIDEMMNSYQSFVGKPGGKGSLGKPKRRVGDDINIYLLETYLEILFTCFMSVKL